jgi:hypothetical protein
MLEHYAIHLGKLTAGAGAPIPGTPRVQLALALAQWRARVVFHCEITYFLESERPGRHPGFRRDPRPGSDAARLS